MRKPDLVASSLAGLHMLRGGCPLVVSEHRPNLNPAIRMVCGYLGYTATDALEIGVLVRQDGTSLIDGRPRALLVLSAEDPRSEVLPGQTIFVPDFTLGSMERKS